MKVPTCCRLVVVTFLAVQLCGGGQPACEAHQHGDWSYSDQEAWSKDFPVSVGKSSRGESPINIMQDQTLHSDNMSLELVNYDQTLPGSMLNNGYTISTNFRKMSLDNRPYLKLNWLGNRSEYYLDEFHFHWGVHGTRGSEHQVDGVRSFAEMHLVHIKRGLTKKDIDEEGAVAVVGVLIELTDQRPNVELANIINVARAINNTDGEMVKEYKIGTAHGLLPTEPKPVYSYQGSLTTPPCYRSVTWLVMGRPIYTTKEQLYQLSSLFTKSDGEAPHLIGNTYRKTQRSGGAVYAISQVRFSDTRGKDNVTKLQRVD